MHYTIIEQPKDETGTVNYRLLCDGQELTTDTYTAIEEIIAGRIRSYDTLEDHYLRSNGPMKVITYTASDFFDEQRKWAELLKRARQAQDGL